MPGGALCVETRCLIGPLTLGFDAEVSVGFLEHDLDLSATDESGENVARMGVEIGQRSVSPSAGKNRPARHEAYLLDMLLAASDARAFVGGLDEAAFRAIRRGQ